MFTTTINNQSFSYNINKKPIRSIRLRVKSPHFFEISCPFLTPNFIVQKFIQSNSDWILKHSKKFSPRQKISSLNKITILDTVYQFFINKTSCNSLTVSKDKLKIILNTNSLAETHIKEIFESGLRHFALNLVKKELLSLSEKFGFNIKKVTLRNQSSRFGSCSSKGNLNFNWQIIFFPIDKFRHILLHELTHLKIKNHSHKFWDQLAFYDPGCKINNLWIKKEGTKQFLL